MEVRILFGALVAALLPLNSQAAPFADVFAETCISLRKVTYTSSNADFDACVKKTHPKVIWEASSKADRYASYEALKAKYANEISSDSSLEAKYKAVVASNASTLTGKWRITSEADPITDVVIASLVLTADSGKSKMGEPITLHLRCDDGKTVTYIDWNDFMTDSAQVTTRVDKNTPQTKEWGSDTSKTASFYPNSPHPERKLEYRDGSDGRSAGNYVIQIDAQPFVKELVTGTKLIARATPYNSAPITAVWNLTGIVAATKDLRSSCRF